MTVSKLKDLNIDPLRKFCSVSHNMTETSIQEDTECKLFVVNVLRDQHIAHFKITNILKFHPSKLNL